MQYILTFIGEAPHFCRMYLLHDKSSTVVSVLRTWLPLAQNQSSSTVKGLRISLADFNAYGGRIFSVRDKNWGYAATKEAAFVETNTTKLKHVTKRVKLLSMSPNPKNLIVRTIRVIIDPMSPRIK
jgi:hypothetical protein